MGNKRKPIVFLSPGHYEFTWKSGSKMIIGDDGIFREFNDFNIKVIDKAYLELSKYNKYLDIRQLEFDNNKLDMGLTDRINYINKYSTEDDVVFSLHGNYNDNKNVSGVDGFYVSTAGKKLIELYKKHSVNNSIKYRSTFKCKKGTWTSLGIILKTRPPAILIEAGFFSNNKDRAIMRTDVYHRQVADSIVDTILGYYNIKPIPRDHSNNLEFLRSNKLIFGNHKNNDYVQYDELDVILERLAKKFIK